MNKKVLLVTIIFLFITVIGQAREYVDKEKEKSTHSLDITQNDFTLEAKRQAQIYKATWDQNIINPQELPQSPSSLSHKLKGGLADVAAIGGASLVPVNIIYDSDAQLIISDIINQGGFITQLSIGNIISAQVPANTLDLLAREHPNALSLWPDREFYTQLDHSVGQVNAPTLWQQGYSGQGMRIAILDSGIDTTHPMLTGKVVSQAVFTGDPTPMDANGHGTHVAGIAAGKNPSGGNFFNGVAPQAQLLNAKVLNTQGVGSESAIIAAINWALNPDNNTATADGAHVISMSFGGPYSDPQSPISAAIEAAIEQGAVVVVSAGNCGSGCPATECQGFVGVTTPGNTPAAITVGAVNDFSEIACFSSGDIVNGTIKPDLVAPGVNIMSSWVGSIMQEQSGTSMAAPHVSGLAALLLQANPGLTAAQVKEIMEQSTIDLGATGKDTSYGSGLVDGSRFLPSSVVSLLQYHLHTPLAITTGTLIPITVTSTSGDVTGITLEVLRPDGYTFIFTIPSLIGQTTWQHIFTDTNSAGIYPVTAHITTSANQHITLSKSTLVVPPQTTGNVQSIITPQIIEYGVEKNYSIIFNNTGAYSTDLVVELQVWNDDLFEDIRFSQATVVPSMSSTSVTIPWKPTKSVGERTLRVAAIFGYQFAENEQNITILDTTLPLLVNASYSPILYVNDTFYPQMTIKDVSAINGSISILRPDGITEEVPLISILKAEEESHLASLYTLPLTGNYSFSMQICDSWANCINTSTYTFNAIHCNFDRKFLVVFDNGVRDDFSALQQNHCISFWDRTSLLPRDTYLSQFPLVYWISGNSWLNSVSDDATNLLLNYSGDLFIEGAEVATAHIDDVLMDVFSIEFNQSLLPQPLETVQLIVSINHSIFDDLGFIIAYNQSLSPAPDELITKNSNALANWNSYGTSLAAFQNDSSKLLFIPFSTKALGSIREQFLTNIINWAFRGTGPDLVVEQLSTPFLIEGTNQGSVFISNKGEQSSGTFRYEVLVDDDIQFVSPLLGPVLPNQTIQNNVSTDFVQGTHNIKITIDSAHQLNESNSLNNDYELGVFVGPIQPNLQVSDMQSTWNDGILSVFAFVANYGGTPITNASVQFNVNTSTATTLVSLVPGQFVNLTSNFTLPKRNYDASITADPLDLIFEANESDNEQHARIYHCSKYPILIVDDSDAEPLGEEPSTSSLWNHHLREEGYCTDIINTSAEQVVRAIDITNHKIVVYTTGEYSPDALNETDAQLLITLNRSLIIEGDDLSYAFNDTALLNAKVQAQYIDDIISIYSAPGFSSTGLFNTNFTLVVNETSYPEKLMPINTGIAAAYWDDGNASIVASVTNVSTTLLTGFVVKHLDNASQKTIIHELVHLAGLSNTEPKIPTALSCNGGGCYATFLQPIDLRCQGSNDWEEDPLLYTIEARQLNSSTWNVIGTHSENQSFLWDISSYPNPTSVTLRCRASDNSYTSAYFQSNLTTALLYIPNTPPQITQLNITPQLAYANNTLQCRAAATDQLSAYLNISFTWLRNDSLQPLLSSTVSTFGGALALSPINASPLIKHDTWTCMVQASDGTYITQMNSSAVIVLNAPPRTPTLVSPANNTYTSQNALNFTYSSSDIDIYDVLTYFIYFNNTLVHATTNNISLLTLPQGSIQWRVKAFDGETNSTLSVRRVFYVDSIAPILSAVNVTPALPTEDEPINFSLTIQDTGIGIDLIRFIWNGQLIFLTNQSGLVTFTLNPGSYTAHDTIPYTWTANDSLGNSAQTSGNVSITNQLPNAVNLTLIIDSPTQSTHGNLSASFAFFDADDEDTQQASEVQWFVNQTRQPQYDNFTYISSTLTHGGESWIFSVRVHDGYDWSDWTNSTQLSIINTPPQIQVQTNLTKVATIPLNYFVNFSDAEQDPVTLTINDTRFSSTIQGMTALFSWNTNVTDAGYHTFSLTATDGELTTTTTLTASVLPLLACANGTTNLGAGAIYNPLRINDDDGGASRTVNVSRFSFFNISILQPPSGPNGSTYVMFVIPDAPAAAAENPYNIGTMCFPTLFQGANPLVLFDTFGLTPFIGPPILPATSAPFTQVIPPIGYAVNVTLQGFIVDFGSAAQITASTTNAILLEIV